MTNIVIFHLDALNSNAYKTNFQRKIHDVLSNDYCSVFYPNVFGFDTTLTSMHAMFFPNNQLNFPIDFARFDKLMRVGVPNEFILGLKNAGYNLCRLFWIQFYL